MNQKLLDFSISSLKRRFWKNFSVFVIFSFLISLLFSIFLISSSIKKELYITLDSLPQIYLQKIVAGKMRDIELDRVFEIENIAGVKSAYPRVWGYYYFQRAGVNFSIVGIDFDLDSFKKSYKNVIKKFSDIDSNNFMIIGEGVEKILKDSYYSDSFNFIKPNGEFLTLKIAGVFSADSALESSDTIVVSLETAKEIFDMNEDEVTDIVVEVANPLEIQTVANKLRILYPDCRVITKDDIKASYQNIFDYKSGFFLALLISSFFSFFILVFEKASSIGKEQTKEIGILKALGWGIGDVLKLKFLESILISFGSFIVGFLISYFWVYIADAIFLKNIFIGFSILKPQFKLIPVFDPSLFVTIFLATIPIYVAATIIPSWRAAVIDPEEAIR